MKFTRMLSPTEEEITKQIVLGNSMKEIAAERFRSVETIKTHIRNIRAKWNARGVVDITRIYTLENADKFKLMILIFFMSIQGYCIAGNLKTERRASSVRVTRTIRTSSRNRKE